MFFRKSPSFFSRIYGREEKGREGGREEKGRREGGRRKEGREGGRRKEGREGEKGRKERRKERYYKLVYTCVFLLEDYESCIYPPPPHVHACTHAR